MGSNKAICGKKAEWIVNFTFEIYARAVCRIDIYVSVFRFNINNIAKQNFHLYALFGIEEIPAWRFRFPSYSWKLLQDRFCFNISFS